MLVLRKSVTEDRKSSEHEKSGDKRDLLSLFKLVFRTRKVLIQIFGSVPLDSVSWSSSVAVKMPKCCGSRIFLPELDFSRIWFLHPRSSTLNWLRISVFSTQNSSQEYDPRCWSRSSYPNFFPPWIRIPDPDPSYCFLPSFFAFYLLWVHLHRSTKSLRSQKTVEIKVFLIVADPGCLSRIPDPTFFHPGSRIPDPHQRI